MSHIVRTRAARFGLGALVTLALGAGTLVTTGRAALAEPGPSPSPIPSPPVSPSPTPSTGPSPTPPATSPTPTSSPPPPPTPSTSPTPTPGPATGAIEGSLTGDAGTPLAYTWVTVQTPTGSVFRHTNADASGHYRVDGLQPDKYLVSFGVPGTGLSQFIPQLKVFPAVGNTTVTAGQTTTANDTALPYGAVTGRFTDRSGKPVAARVSLQDTYGIPINMSSTNEAGEYTLRAFVGTYVVEFRYGDGVIQYAHQTIDQLKATRFPLAAGATVVVDETRVPLGSVAGRLTDNDGTPATGANVQLHSKTGNLYLNATTAADGTYRIEQVPAGDYQVHFSTADYRRRQYAFHTTDESKAATVTVAEDRTTVVDDSLIATGSLVVTATDASTGKPVADFCAYLWNGGTDNSTCSNGTGTVTMSDIPEGAAYRLDLSSPGGQYLYTPVEGVVVTGGQTTTRAVVLRPAAVIETTVLDRKTRRPVAGACVLAVPVKETDIASSGGGYCSDEQGKLRVSDLDGGSYLLYVRPTDGVHGAQWVGPTGGTGNPDRAKRMDAKAGAATTAPTIYLDGAGSISGKVTDAATGAPVEWVCVGPLAVDPVWAHLGECPGGITTADGSYTIPNLGPYDWPVNFASGTYASQWSGGAAIRTKAKPVKVAVGKTAKADAKLSKGTTVKGRILDAAGKPASGYVVVVSAVTGEPVGPWADGPDGSYEVLVLPQQPVRIKYRADKPPYTWRWYRGAPDFDHATTVAVGRNPVTVDVVLPAD